jgi:DNA-binding CsgD family transcriptional regulator
MVRALWVLSALSGKAGRPGPLNPDELNELTRQHGDEGMFGIASIGAGYLAERTHRDLDAAYEHLREAAEELERSGNRPDMAMALTSLGGVEMQRGNLDAARSWIQRGLDTAIAAQDDYNTVGAYYTRGWLEILCDDRATARADFNAALDHVMDSDVLSVAEQAEGIAEAVRVEDPVRALTLYGGAARLRDEVQTPAGLPWSLWIDPGLDAARGALAAGAAEAAFQAGRALRPDALVALARAAGTAKKGGNGGLSKRELEVARLVTAGLTNRDIAQRLFLSERTVESHVDHILGKLDFRSRTQVAAWVAENGLTTQPQN